MLEEMYIQKYNVYFSCISIVYIFFSASLQIFNTVIFPISGKFLPIEEGDTVKKKNYLYSIQSILLASYSQWSWCHMRTELHKIIKEPINYGLHMLVS